MKRRRKIILGLAALALLLGILCWNSGTRAQRDLDRTRRALRAQGFRIDLKEFNLALPPELSRRAALLAPTTRAELTNRARPYLAAPDTAMFPTPAGKDAALVLWRANKLKTYRSDDLWSELRETFAQQRTLLETMRQAVLGGRFGSSRLAAKDRRRCFPTSPS